MICSTDVVMVLAVMEALGIQKLSGLYIGEDENTASVRCTSVTITILRSSRRVVVNLWAEPPLPQGSQISCISDIDIATHNGSKIVVMK